MKNLYIFLFLLSSAFAEDTPKPTIETLTAEINLLRAQTIQSQLEFSYAMLVCQAPDLMMARITTIQTQKEVEAAKRPSKSDKKEKEKK